MRPFNPLLKADGKDIVQVDVSPYWCWGRYGKDCVWYQSVRVYRQSKMHRWEEVFEEVRADLSLSAIRRRG
jgi:hypothetical protein